MLLLYLGGVVKFLHYHAHRLSTNVAAAIVPLALVIALGALIRSRTPATLLSKGVTTSAPTETPQGQPPAPTAVSVAALAESMAHPPQ